MENLINLIIFIVLMTIGYLAGTWAEKKHYESIEKREKEYLHLPAVTIKETSVHEADVEKAEIVYGNAVISIDYFKRILARLRNIFGGNVKSYESLIDRARREAILRMKEMAPDSAMIINVRIETSSISKSERGNVGCIEALAYGTAVKVKDTKDKISSSI